jgi:hypothetical protein
MEEYRRRLERTQLKIYAALLVLLFGRLLTLPWIGQVIWIAFIMAIYIRLTHVITRKEELLEDSTQSVKPNQMFGMACTGIRYTTQLSKIPSKPISLSLPRSMLN